MISIHEAIDAVLAAVRPLPAEEVPLLDALGRAAAADDRLARGRALVRQLGHGRLRRARRRARRPAAASSRVVVDIPAGRWVGEAVGAGEAAKIMTGAPLPPGVDTVVQVEHTEQTGDDARGAARRRSQAPTCAAPPRTSPWATSSSRAAPVSARPRSACSRRSAVRRSPSPGGRGSRSSPPAASCVLPGQPLGPGQIRNSNSFTADGQVLAAGGEPVLLGIARDDLDETRRLLAAALEHDVVITSGGVSVGEYDFVKQVQDELGVERRFWGVATKPGKPLAFGTRGDTLVFGVPGQPRGGDGELRDVRAAGAPGACRADATSTGPTCSPPRRSP